MIDSGGIVIDDLKAMARELEQKEREVVFEAAHAIGEAAGRKHQVLDLIQKLENERKSVDIAGKTVETAALDRKPEKR